MSDPILFVYHLKGAVSLEKFTGTFEASGGAIEFEDANDKRAREDTQDLRHAVKYLVYWQMYDCGAAGVGSRHSCLSLDSKCRQVGI